MGAVTLLLVTERRQPRHAAPARPSSGSRR